MSAGPAFANVTRNDLHTWWENVRVSTPSADDLTTIELLVLYEAGGDNTVGNAFMAVQLYAVFEREQELFDAVESALLRLFDLGLVWFVQATPDVGYTAKRFELPAMTRDQLLAALEADDLGGEDIWYDPTAEGEAVLEEAPEGRIPEVSGIVRYPWLE
jgi:hypothetical protein